MPIRRCCRHTTKPVIPMIYRILQNRANSLACAWAINSLAYSIVYPFLPIYLHSERGYPMATVGLIFPLMGGSIIVSPLLAGYLTDRIGRQFMMQFGQTARAAMFLLLAGMAFFHAPFWLFAAALTVNAGIGTFFQIGSDAFLSDISTPAERPRIFSRIRIGTNIGWALGPMLGAFLMKAPFWMLFILTAALCLFGAWYTGKCCSVRRGAPSAPVSRAVPGNFTVRRLFTDSRLTGTLGCSFILFLLTSQLYSVMSVYATGVVGLSSNALGLIYSLNGAAIIVFQMPMTRLLEHFRLSFPARLVFGTALYTAGYFFFFFSHNAWMMAASVFIITLGEAAVMPSLYSGVSSLAPSGGTGRYMASLELTRGVGYAAGPYFGAMLFQAYSPQPLLLWGLLSLFGCGAAAGYLLLASRFSARRKVREVTLKGNRD